MSPAALHLCAISTCKTMIIIFLATISLAEATPERPYMRHRYPEPGNFSFVSFDCMNDEFMDEHADGATFVRNNATNVLNAKGMRVVTTAAAVGNGSVALVLTQQTEGRFHCVSNRSSSNAVTLAAQPEKKFSNYFIDETGDSVDLTCGIQPGVERNMYSVTWKQYLHDDEMRIRILDSHSFNISVDVTNQTNVVYGCEVTVVHDSHNTVIYSGGRFFIKMDRSLHNSPSARDDALNQSENDGVKGNSAPIFISIMVGICTIIIFAVAVAVISVTVHIKWRLNRNKHPNNKQYYKPRVEGLTITSTSPPLAEARNKFELKPNEPAVPISRSPCQLPEFHQQQRPFHIEFNQQQRPFHIGTPVILDDQESPPEFQRGPMKTGRSNCFDDNDYDTSDFGRVVSSGRLSDDISFSMMSSTDLPEPHVSNYSCYSTTSSIKHSKSIVELDALQSSPHPLYDGPFLVPPTKLQSLFDPQSLNKFGPHLKPLKDKHFASRKTSGSSTTNLVDTTVADCTNPHCQCHSIRIDQLAASLPATHRTEGVVVNKADRRKWVTRAYNLDNVTEKGYKHTDNENGFIIEFPEGAVPEQMNLTISIAICLYGPFKYPENVRSVSPIVWVCVKNFENFKFLKPVKVSLQHCINTNGRAEDIDSFGLQFLKSSHLPDKSGVYSFQKADGVLEQGPGPNYLTLSTTHFCHVCLGSEINSKTLASTQYCLTSYQPLPGRDEIRFYVSFFLDACLSVIQKQCDDGFKKLSKHKFFFRHDKRLEIDFSDPDKWLLCMECAEEILADDVDFMGKDADVLEREENEGMYPPRFTIRVHPLPGAEHAKIRFKFSGAEKKLSMDILLKPDVFGGGGLQKPQLLLPPRESSSSSSMTSLPGLYTPSPDVTPVRDSRAIYHIPHNTFMENVAVHARTKWRFFGIMIDIPPDILDSLPGDDSLQCFLNVYEYWVRRGTPSITWETIVSVLDSDTVDEKMLADTVKRKFIPPVQPIPLRANTSSSTGSTYTKSTHDTGYASQDSASNQPPVTMIVSDV